ncbi:hypothetical protein CTQ56_003113 [Salmonella enterica subsp. houtenae]|nr:hypothetical protein [Salmonella enterica]EDU3887270.1 hypothetical protein [Salmonella enterica subsp. enterica serovar Kingston]EDV5855859.1 hypothetical protein [Salmonella enterica subsp. enterica serovar Anatum]EEE2346686.1 hypothetical protein [Salmonella enterica subsp. houtenae]EEG5824018.1 hypothetical protein [Salmonella enterica subsp. enterica]EEI9365409.1 hypothetical protein [Salmonella enterica subsp. enterica serovar Takoradi]
MFIAVAFQDGGAVRIELRTAIHYHKNEFHAVTSSFEVALPLNLVPQKGQ